MPRPRKPLAWRLWSRVKENFDTGCWEWQGGTNSDGYGKIVGEDGKTLSVHKAAWLLLKGEVPSGLLLRHTCDNRRCVNLYHLKLGTLADNVKDMIERGRHNPACGEDNPSSKLTGKQVNQIRDKYKTGNFTQLELSKEYQVTRALIGYIVRYKIWRNV